MKTQVVYNATDEQMYLVADAGTDLRGELGLETINLNATEVIDYVAAVWSDLGYCPTMTPQVYWAHAGQGYRAKATCGARQRPVIEVAPSGMNKVTILHEIAHIVTYYAAQDGDFADQPPLAGHGPEFTYIFAKLVEIRLGRDAFAKLVDYYRQRGIGMCRSYGWLKCRQPSRLA